MENLVERKQKLFSIINGYTAFLERQKSDEYKKRAEDMLSRKKQVERDRYHIALVGFAKRGKSTLLNVLLGNRDDHNLSPVSIRACTAAIVMYYDAALYPEAEGKEGIIIRFNDGSSKPIGKDELSKYVDQKNPGFNEDNAKRIDHIEVYGNFPLIETRGVFVDTPGLGALYDQNYLAARIIPEVDVILCPVAADNFGQYDEKDFLVNLPVVEKGKLMYVLTRVDAQKEHLDDVISEFKKLAGTISGGTPHIYQVAARKVLDAYENGKSPKEVEQVKKDCGMKALEDALDEKLRTRSTAEDRIRSVCKELETFFSNDNNRLDGIKEDLNRQSGDLDKKIKELGTACQNLEKKFADNTKKLKPKWEKEIKRFVERLENKKANIIKELTSEVEGKKIFALIGYSSKMVREIQSLLKDRLNEELLDLQEKLENIIKDFAKELESDFNEDIEIYNSYYPKNSLKNEVGTIVGGGVAAGGAVFRATSVGGALASISTAATGVTVAIAQSGEIMASGGIIAKIGAWLGIGKAATVGGTVAAAQGALVTALVSGIVPILAGGAVAVLAYRIGTGIAKGNTIDKIPEMVKTQLKEAAKSIEKSSEEMLDYVLNYFQENLKTLLTGMQDELKTTKEAVDALGAQEKLKEIERNKQELEKLKMDLTRFMNDMEVNKYA